MKKGMTLFAVVFMWLAGTGYTAAFQYAINGVPFDTDGITHYVVPGTVTLDLMCLAADRGTFYDGEFFCLERQASLDGTTFNPANLPGQWWVEDLGYYTSDELGGMTDNDGELIEGRFLYLWGDSFYFPNVSVGNLWTSTFQMPALSKVIIYDVGFSERFAIAAVPEPASAITMLLGAVWMAVKRRR